ncbi:MAG: Spy/CpxP family protein refolding chaperone [Legionella sp.]|nr:Spy/CpxP family protein refolding chaperone [Legionella sp.]
MYKKILSVVAFALSLSLNQAVFADSWGCGEGIKQMVQSLNLKDDQKAKIEPVLEQLKSNMKQMATQMNALDTQINQQANAATVDQSQVNGLVDQKAKMIGEMMKAKMLAKSQIMAQLTPEQKTQLQNMMTKLEEKMAAKFKSCHQDD